MLEGEGSLRPGDKVPFCYGMTADQRYYSFEDQAGRAAVLILAGDSPPSAVADLMDAFVLYREPLAAHGADACVLAMAGAQGWATAEVPAGLRLIHCMESGLFAAAGPRASVLVIDRALRLVAALDGRSAAAAFGQALEALSSRPQDAPREVSSPAPVLIAPGVLDAGVCRRLVEAFEAGDHVQGAMASADAQGSPISRIDLDKKNRRDLALDPATSLHAEVVGALAARLVPEIAQAFQVQVAHLDRILIARYDDTGGYFRRHRDNSSAQVAYREFAVSVNLNAGDYEGGRLVFPEYSDDPHNPPTGAGLVFSASLLHEAAPVTSGRRYVLLTFLHSQAAEERRLAGMAAA